MAERGRPKAPLVLTDDERQTLQRWSRRAKTSQALALRCKIVLACADGQTNQAVAEQLGIWPQTVAKWRGRFVRQRLEGLSDEPRPGRPRTITDAQVEQVLTKTLEEPPPHQDTHWSTRSMARATGLSQTAISRIWRAFGLKPHLVQTWKLSTDPSSSTRSATSSGCTWTHPRRRWCCAWMTSARSRRWTAPRRACRPCRPRRPGAATTRSAMAPPACSPG